MFRTAAKQTFYHGTKGKNLRSILKHGLRADPGHKEWTFEEYGDSVTFGGTYLTVNLEDALGHTGGDSDKVLVITQIETRTPEVVPDEDVMLHIAVAAHHLRQLLPEYVWYHRTFKPQLLEDIESGALDLRDYLEEWIILVSQSDEWRQMRFDPKLLLRYPDELLELMTLAAEHSTKHSEQVVRDYAEVLNGLMKKVHKLTDPYDDLSVRSLKDIGYRGSNRITAVLYYKIVKSGGVFSPYDLVGNVAYGNPEDPTVQEAIRTISLESGGTTPPRVAVWEDQKGNVVYEANPRRRQIASVVKTAAKLHMYHGTCTGPDGSILHSILKEGLKPDPPKRAYKSPYPDEDDDDFGYDGGLDLQTEVTMHLDEPVGGAYLTNSVEEAKRYAQNACGEHGGNPVLISAQIETRSPEVRIDEDFMINYVWEFVKADFEATDEDQYYRELFTWIESDEPNWQKIAKDWIEQQFPHVKISEHRWNQILPAAAQMIQDIMVITFLQNHEADANRESRPEEDDYWDVDHWYTIQEHLYSYKENIAFVTEHLTEITDPPAVGQHNIRILKNVGYRGANRVLAVISWTQQSYYGGGRPGEYTQVGKVYYARSAQDAQDLLNASGVVGKYSKWTWRDRVLHDERVPPEQLKLPNVAHVVVGGAVYRQAADPQRDREYRRQALEAWEKVLEYLREHRATPFYGKFLVWFERFAPKYRYLLLAIDSKRADGTKGSFGEAHFPKAEYAIELHALDESFWEHEDEFQQEELVWELNNPDVRSTFVHEFIHYLDRMRRTKEELSKKELEERAKRKEDPVVYFSNAEEFNAWYQALVLQLEDVFDEMWGPHEELLKGPSAEKTLGTYDEFYKFVDLFNQNIAKSYWDLDKLEPKWQRKLTKRLYGLWQDLREKYL